MAEKQHSYEQGEHPLVDPPTQCSEEFFAALVKNWAIRDYLLFTNRLEVSWARCFGIKDFPATLRPLLEYSKAAMATDYLQKILTARVYDVALESPLERASALSSRLANQVLLKREDQQAVFSFKLRGAYNKMAHLSPDQLKRGVIAASAGNHAQGVALSAERLGCRATIVMPVTTPQIKVQAVQSRGAQVLLHGDSYSEAYERAAGEP